MFEKVYELIATGDCSFENIELLNEEEKITLFKYLHIFESNWYLEQFFDRPEDLSLILRYNVYINYNLNTLIDKYKFCKKKIIDDSIILMMESRIRNMMLNVSSDKYRDLLNKIINYKLYDDYKDTLYEMRDKLLNHYKSKDSRKKLFEHIFRYSYYGEKFKRRTIETKYNDLINKFDMILEFFDFFNCWELDDYYLINFFKIYIIASGYNNYKKFFIDITDEQKAKVFDYIKDFHKKERLSAYTLTNVYQVFHDFYDEKQEKQIITKLKYGAENEKELISCYRSIREVCKLEKNKDFLDVQLTLYDLKH